MEVIVGTLSPREEQILSEIKEGLEIKLVELLMCNDLTFTIVLRNEIGNDGFIRFFYSSRTSLNDYNFLTVAVGKMGRKLYYQLRSKLLPQQSYDFDDHRGLIKFIRENIR